MSEKKNKDTTRREKKKITQTLINISGCEKPKTEMDIQAQRAKIKAAKKVTKQIFQEWRNVVS